MSGSTSRRKGQTFERLARKFFDRWLMKWTHVGTSEADVELHVNGHVFIVECKNVARVSLAEWWAQAEDTAKKIAVVGGHCGLEIPVLFHKRKGRTDPADQWITMSAGRFYEILERLENTDVERGSYE